MDSVVPVMSLTTLRLLRGLLADTPYNGKGENPAQGLREIAAAFDELDAAIADAEKAEGR